MPLLQGIQARRRRRRPGWAVGFLCWAAALPLPAQVSDSGATMEPVGSGVYAIVHADAIHDWPSGVTDWPHGNTGVVVGDRCVLVVDATFYPSRAAADIELIRRVTDRPVCYLVNTHWHGDHTHGNAVYRDRFPSIQIVGTALTRDYIAINQLRYPHRATGAGSSALVSLERLQRIQQAGKDSTGRALSATERASLRIAIGELETQQREFRKIQPAAATLIFDGELRLDLGGVEVTVRSRGHANSPDDLTVGVSREGILFAGDIVVYPVPFPFESYPTYWIEVLRQIEAEPIRVLVPGHGPVMRDLGYVAKVRELLQAVVDRVRPLVVEGKTPEEIVTRIGMDDFKGRFVDARVPNSAGWWEQSIAPLVDRAYWCVVGYRC